MMNLWFAVCIGGTFKGATLIYSWYGGNVHGGCVCSPEASNSISSFVFVIIVLGVSQSLSLQ